MAGQRATENSRLRPIATHKEESPPNTCLLSAVSTHTHREGPKGDELTDLTDRVALVTGGSSGLGRVIVQAFARAGADVVIASRRLASCEETALEVERDTGQRALPLAFDAGHWNDAEPLIDRVVAEFGKIDILVNNAGMSLAYDSPGTITEGLWDEVFGVNVKGPFRLAAVTAPRMVSVGSGSIINISSIQAVRPGHRHIPYAAAKSALNAITIAMAHAFGPAVRVNAIMPGTLMTDAVVLSSRWDAEAFARRAETFAMRRGGEPAEIAGAALYLASDLSSYTTGSILTVDGGIP